MADRNALALRGPRARHRPRQLFQLHALRLSAVEDGFDDAAVPEMLSMAEYVRLDTENPGYQSGYPESFFP